MRSGGNGHRATVCLVKRFLERNWLECVRTAARRQSLTQADAVLAAVKARFAVAFGQP